MHCYDLILGTEEQNEIRANVASVGQYKRKGKQTLWQFRQGRQKPMAFIRRHAQRTELFQVSNGGVICARILGTWKNGLFSSSSSLKSRTF